MSFKPEISVGDVVALLAVLFAVMSFYITRKQDRNKKTEDYAQKIRQASKNVIARLDRWQNWRLHYFDQIQPLLVDADSELVTGQDVISIRDHLWKNLVTLQSLSLEKIEDEQIEMAYSDLYGYDPRIQALFTVTVDQLRTLDEAIHGYGLHMSQHLVLFFGSSRSRAKSAQLGNLLRLGFSKLAETHRLVSEEIISSFQTEVTKLIEADDKAVCDKTIAFVVPVKMFSTPDDLFERIDSSLNLKELRLPVLSRLQCHFCTSFSPNDKGWNSMELGHSTSRIGSSEQL